MREILKKIIGERMLGVVDYIRKPELKKSWGGPFNNQQYRQQIYLELIKKIHFDAIVETGTFRGTTTHFLFEKSNLPVYTTELHPRFYTYSKLRFISVSGIHIYNLDSRDFLRQLSSDAALIGKQLFFYLDAHWNDDLPLLEEIKIIFNNWPSSVIMIDDFKVPDDPDYTYDNYGAGKELSLEYLKPLSYLKFFAFFPSKKGNDETGFKRGCVILVRDEELIEKIKTFSKINLLYSNYAAS